MDPAPPDPAHAARPNRYGRRRAAVLALVYVLMAAHMAHWKLTGSTLAPLELNEVMVTLELGVVTAGFLFMLAAVLSALVFGRFFCSWGCHVLALEDLCAWLLAKVGVHPKPVRSRALLFVPPVAMLYMFAWPQVERWFAGRALPEVVVQGDEAGWASFVTTDFWRNLPPVSVALFTFLVCGFLIVYVLGSRSFCRYACPYGAAFGLADKLAPGRIVARDGCTGCGTCTATCQSDIRVHEELAAYGAVVSSSCLKDLDCVGVCPSGAVAYGFTKPALFRAKGVEGAPKRVYDFTLVEDAGLGLVFLVALFAFRGLYGVVPFLLSLALAGIAAYVAVIAARLLRRASVKAGRVQLKVTGRFTRAGAAFGVMAVALAALLAQAAFVQLNHWLGQRAAAGGEVELALARLERVDRFGLMETPGNARELARLQLAAGRPADAEPWLRRILARRPGEADLRRALAEALAGAGRFEEAVAELELAVEHEPSSAPNWYNLAVLRARLGRDALAIAAYRESARLAPEDADTWNNLGFLLARGDDFVGAERCFRIALAHAPEMASARFNLGALLVQLGRADEATPHLERAARLDPRYAELLGPAR